MAFFSRQSPYAKITVVLAVTLIRNRNRNTGKCNQCMKKHDINRTVAAFETVLASYVVLCQ